MMESAIPSRSSEVDTSFADLVEELTNRLHAGEEVDLDAIMKTHPEHAERLARLQPALCLLADASRSRADGRSVDTNSHGGALLGATLGDFRILREIGRGGMGVVYEAEQVSLGRRVALKVLSLAAGLDARQLQRFQNEAGAAAQLHHTNIVPVHFVGCTRGVHFYAMQLIRGQSLAEAIAEMRGAAEPRPGESRTLVSGSSSPLPDGRGSAVGANDTPCRATLSTLHSGEQRAYFRTVAELGIQAAMALAHAHQAGIVHRDVKPANLLVATEPPGPTANTNAPGFRLWITDFGLAQVQSDVRLTMTGDLLGTLRYMSPEQAMAKRELVDHRSDIYSLGATLYELLTLEPVFPGEDRHELLCQIASDEPRPPRRLNKAIPPELEVVMLKALEKTPADRYATAQDVGDDLRRWLEDQPIRARRPTWRQLAMRWARRHKPLVVGMTGAMLVGLMVLGGSVGWILRDGAARRARSAQAILPALEDSDVLQAKGLLPEALSAARRADGVLAGAEVDEELRERVRARLGDLELVENLERVRLDVELGRSMQTVIMPGDWEARLRAGHSAYQRTFRQSGLDLEALSPREAGKRIRETTVAVEIAAALGHWACLGPSESPAIRRLNERLLQIARAADPDAWRSRLRDAMEKRDRQALRSLAHSRGVFELPPVTLALIGSRLAELPQLLDKADRRETEAFVREAQRRHPGDFRLTEIVRGFYADMGAPSEVQHHFASLMTAIRPSSPFAHEYLGNALAGLGRYEEAIAEYREVLRLDKDCRLAQENIETCEKIGIPRQARLRLVLQGKAQPKDEWERLYFAGRCVAAGQIAAAVRLYTQAFAANPKVLDPRRGDRYNAACAVALAGCGLGRGQGRLEHKDRARLRQQALDWLRADLAAWQELLAKFGPKPEVSIAQMMQLWLNDDDLAGVRDPESLAVLPAGERNAWRQFWADVASFRQRATAAR